MVISYDLTVRGEIDPAASSVPRSGVAAPRRAESVPVAWFEPPAAASSLKVGDDVVVVGRVRRRFFRAGGATASRTEVVAAAVVPARAPARVRTAIARCVTELEGAG
jgi:hypothetical protein